MTWGSAGVGVGRIRGLLGVGYGVDSGGRLGVDLWGPFRAHRGQLGVGFLGPSWADYPGGRRGADLGPTWGRLHSGGPRGAGCRDSRSICCGLARRHRPRRRISRLSMSAGWFHSLLLRSDGSVVAFGRDDSGAEGAQAPRHEALTPPGGLRYLRAAAGLYHSVPPPPACAGGRERAAPRLCQGRCEIGQLCTDSGRGTAVASFGRPRRSARGQFCCTPGQSTKSGVRRRNKSILFRIQSGSSLICLVWWFPSEFEVTTHQSLNGSPIAAFFRFVDPHGFPRIPPRFFDRTYLQILQFSQVSSCAFRVR